MKDYSEILGKLKEIDWKPIADKALAVLQDKASKELTNLSAEDRARYEACVQDLAKLSILLLTADEEEKTVLQKEAGFVKVSMESMEARNDLFAYRQVIDVIGAVIASAVKIGLTMI